MIEQKENRSPAALPPEDLPPCPLNRGVGCGDSRSRCPYCGWNPAVERARKEKVRIALKERRAAA